MLAWQSAEPEARLDSVTVSAKGAIIIPKKIRDRHGITPGSRVRIVEDGDALLIVPARKMSIEEGRGILRPEGDEKSLTQEYLEEKRREIELEERRIERWMRP